MGVKLSDYDEISYGRMRTLVHMVELAFFRWRNGEITAEDLVDIHQIAFEPLNLRKPVGCDSPDPLERAEAQRLMDRWRKAQTLLGVFYECLNAPYDRDYSLRRDWGVPAGDDENLVRNSMLRTAWERNRQRIISNHQVDRLGPFPEQRRHLP